MLVAFKLGARRGYIVDYEKRLLALAERQLSLNGYVKGKDYFIYLTDLSDKKSIATVAQTVRRNADSLVVLSNIGEWLEVEDYDVTNIDSMEFVRLIPQAKQFIAGGHYKYGIIASEYEKVVIAEHQGLIKLLGFVISKEGVKVGADEYLVAWSASRTAVPAQIKQSSVNDLYLEMKAEDVRWTVKEIEKGLAGEDATYRDLWRVKSALYDRNEVRAMLVKQLSNQDNPEQVRMQAMKVIKAMAEKGYIRSAEIYLEVLEGIKDLEVVGIEQETWAPKHALQLIAIALRSGRAGDLAADAAFLKYTQAVMQAFRALRHIRPSSSTFAGYAKRSFTNDYLLTVYKQNIETARFVEQRIGELQQTDGDISGDDALIWRDWQWNNKQELLAEGTLYGLQRAAGQTTSVKTLPSGDQKTLRTRVDTAELNNKLNAVRRRLLIRHHFFDVLPLKDIIVRVRWPMYKSAIFEMQDGQMIINIDIRSFEEPALLYIVLEHELTDLLLEHLLPGINPALREVFTLLTINVQRFIQLRDADKARARRLLSYLNEKGNRFRGILPIYEKVARDQGTAWWHYVGDVYRMVVDVDQKVYWRGSWATLVEALQQELGLEKGDQRSILIAQMERLSSIIAGSVGERLLTMPREIARVERRDVRDMLLVDMIATLEAFNVAHGARKIKYVLTKHVEKLIRLAQLKGDVTTLTWKNLPRKITGTDKGKYAGTYWVVTQKFLQEGYFSKRKALTAQKGRNFDADPQGRDEESGDDTLVWRKWQWREKQVLIAQGSLEGLTLIMDETSGEETLTEDQASGYPSRVDIAQLNSKLEAVRRRLLIRHHFFDRLLPKDIVINVKWPMYKSATFEKQDGQYVIDLDVRSFEEPALLYIVLEHELIEILLTNLLPNINPALREMFMCGIVNVQRAVQLRDEYPEIALRMFKMFQAKADTRKGFGAVYSNIYESPEQKHWTDFIDQVYEEITDVEKKVYWKSVWEGVIASLHAELGFKPGTKKLSDEQRLVLIERLERVSAVVEAAIDVRLLPAAPDAATLSVPDIRAMPLADMVAALEAFNMTHGARTVKDVLTGHVEKLIAWAGLEGDLSTIRWKDLPRKIEGEHKGQYSKTFWVVDQKFINQGYINKRKAVRTDKAQEPENPLVQSGWLKVVQKERRILTKPVEVSRPSLSLPDQATVRLVPAPEGTGIAFRRTDIENAPLIPADVQYVSSTDKGVMLTRDGVSVSMVEHFLSALMMSGLRDVIIETDQAVLPLFDGSALQLKEIVLANQKDAGSAAREVLVVQKPVIFGREQEGIKVIARPFNGFRITYMINFEGMPIGRQKVSFDIRPEVFWREISPARTVVFEALLESLHKRGLFYETLAGELLVLGKDQTWNKDLRFEDEVVRHKVADIIGDLALLPFDVQGHITVIEGGHRDHIGFARMLNDIYEKQQAPQSALKVTEPASSYQPTIELIRAAKEAEETKRVHWYRDHPAAVSGGIAFKPEDKPALTLAEGRWNEVKALPGAVEQLLIAKGSRMALPKAVEGVETKINEMLTQASTVIKRNALIRDMVLDQIQIVVEYGAKWAVRYIPRQAPEEAHTIILNWNVFGLPGMQRNDAFLQFSLNEALSGIRAFELEPSEEKEALRFLAFIHFNLKEFMRMKQDLAQRALIEELMREYDDLLDLDSGYFSHYKYIFNYAKEWSHYTSAVFGSRHAPTRIKQAGEDKTFVSAIMGFKLREWQSLLAFQQKGRLKPFNQYTGKLHKSLEPLRRHAAAIRYDEVKTVVDRSVRGKVVSVEVVRLFMEIRLGDKFVYLLVDPSDDMQQTLKPGGYGKMFGMTYNQWRRLFDPTYGYRLPVQPKELKTGTVFNDGLFSYSTTDVASRLWHTYDEMIRQPLSKLIKMIGGDRQAELRAKVVRLLQQAQMDKTPSQATWMQIQRRKDLRDLPLQKEIYFQHILVYLNQTYPKLLLGQVDVTALPIEQLKLWPALSSADMIPNLLDWLIFPRRRGPPGLYHSAQSEKLSYADILARLDDQNPGQLTLGFDDIDNKPSDGKGPKLFSSSFGAFLAYYLVSGAEPSPFGLIAFGLIAIAELIYMTIESGWWRAQTSAPAARLQNRVKGRSVRTGTGWYCASKAEQIEALSRLGKPELREKLANGDADTKLYALAVFEQRRDVASVAMAFEAKEMIVRLEAARILVNLGDKAAQQAIVAALAKEKIYYVRDILIDGVRRYQLREAVAVLKKIIATSWERAELRNKAADTVIELVGIEALRDISIEIVKRDRDELHEHILLAGKVKDYYAADEIMAVWESSDKDVEMQKTIARAMGDMGGEIGIDHLIRILEESENRFVVELAVDGLIKNPDKRAEGILFEQLNRPYRRIVQKSLQALILIGDEDTIHDLNEIRLGLPERVTTFIGDDHGEEIETTRYIYLKGQPTGFHLNMQMIVKKDNPLIAEIAAAIIQIESKLIKIRQSRKIDLAQITDQRVAEFMAWLKAHDLDQDIVMMGGGAVDVVTGRYVNDIDFTVKLSLTDEERVLFLDVRDGITSEIYERAEQKLAKLARALNVTVDKILHSFNQDEVYWQGKTGRLKLEYSGPIKQVLGEQRFYLKRNFVDSVTGAIFSSTIAVGLMRMAVDADGQLYGRVSALDDLEQGYLRLAGRGGHLTLGVILRILRLRHRYGVDLSPSDMDMIVASIKKIWRREQQKLNISTDFLAKQIVKIAKDAKDICLTVQELHELGLTNLLREKFAVDVSAIFQPYLGRPATKQRRMVLFSEDTVFDISGPSINR